MRRCLLSLGLVLQLMTASGCRAEPAGPNRPSQGAQVVPAFAPPQTRTLRSFGAAGDGAADDSAALARALRGSQDFCLDGQGATYRVSGTLEVSSDLCLRNATLVQSLAPVDTTPFIRRHCQVGENASLIVDCGNPTIPPRDLARLSRALSVRTLLIRPQEGGLAIRVTLDRLKVDRGLFAESGSRTDSAGIWLEGAARVDFRDVEITGNGKGFGLLLIRSRNVTLTNLHIHDMVWAPYPGDAPLTRARVSATGWNSVPIQEFRALGQDGVRAAKFYGVRVQEQISCAFLAEVQNVRIENGRVSRCMARFDGGDLPWQADGLSIGQSSSDVVIRNLAVDSTWEGVDVVGTGRGVDRLSIDDLTVTNSFSFGLKIGYRSHDAQVRRLKVVGAGLAGVMLYGPVKNVAISGADISGIGTVLMSTGSMVGPWPAASRAGIQVDGGAAGSEAARQAPDGVLITDARVSPGAGSTGYAFGLLNRGGRNVRIVRFTPSGFNAAGVRRQ